MDPGTYEHLRNKTLLFFVEKLLDPSHSNNQAFHKRTLHDLSCQFGSKGFTKEMRQIAGGSQSGLKKFLLTYPSIFKIDGDMVSYNSSTSAHSSAEEAESSESPENTVSIDNEAVEYFRERLIQYGIGIYVPIKSLLGHRSQAPPHIRHVSGQHIREFTTFLSKYPDTFIINTNDEVMLKEFEHYSTTVCLANKQIDKNRIIELIEFYANCIQERGPMLTEQLFCAGNDKFDEAWEHFKTPNDLTTFFKMYPQCFQVHSNVVTFSDSYKVGLEYLKRSSGVAVIAPVKSVPKPIKPPPAKPIEPPKPVEKEPEPVVEPKKSLLKQRVSKILLQAINQNTEHDYKHDNSNNLQPVPHTVQFSNLCSGDSDELRNYILSRTTIVTNQRKATQIIDEIISANSPVAIDFEGINLGNDGQITLVQVGTHRGTVFIFDVLTSPGLIETGVNSVLGKLLTHENVVKVMHDCRNDSVNLHRQFGIRLRSVFDTQVAHIVVQYETNPESNNNELECSSSMKTQNNSKNISLNNLCSLYATLSNPFKDKVKSVYRHDQKYWSRRPLTKQMIAYASCDVMCLVPSIHETLKSKISDDYLSLFNELCEEQILTHIQPDEIRSRRRLRKNEADLKTLRDKLDKAFSDNNTTVVLSNREMRLLKHLNLTDEEKEKLKLSLKVAKKLEKMSSSMVEACSSDSTSNSEMTSLEYTDVRELQDPRIAQINSLEAIINRLIDPEMNNNRGCADAFTQTISTGDIVITKVFDD